MWNRASRSYMVSIVGLVPTLDVFGGNECMLFYSILLCRIDCGRETMVQSPLVASGVRVYEECVLWSSSMSAQLGTDIVR